MVCFKTSTDSSFWRINPAMISGSVSHFAGTFVAVGFFVTEAGGWVISGTGEEGIKPSRLLIAMSGSLMSGSDLPKLSMSFSLLAGEASMGVTSTNNRPAAVRIGAGVVNRKKDKPSGFMASVII